MTSLKKITLRHYLTIRHFYLISFTFAFAAFLFSAVFFINDYVKFKSDISYDLKIHNERIEQKFSDSLFYTRLIMSYVGRQVANNDNAHDYNFIKGVLNGYRMPENGLMSWSILSWANKQHQIVISRGIGIMKEKKDLSHRDYIPLTRHRPEAVQMGKPVKGIISGLYSIPVGYGVVDTHRKYIGAVISGIVIHNLQAQMESLIGNSEISFALIDVRNGLITQSSGGHISDEAVDKVLSKMKDSNLTKLVNGRSYYKKVKGYPYIIGTIYNRGTGDSESRVRFSVYLMVMLLLLSFLSLIFYGFHEKIVSPIVELSEFAAKIYCGEIPRKTPKFDVKEMNDLAKKLHKIDGLISRDDRIKNK
jgi:hypothetical protein